MSSSPPPPPPPPPAPAHVSPPPHFNSPPPRPGPHPFLHPPPPTHSLTPPSPTPPPAALRPSSSGATLSQKEKEKEEEEDEKVAIVIDIGTGTIKAGFAGDDAPRAVFPNMVARPFYLGVMVGMGNKDSYVGDEGQAKRGVCTIKYPIEHGIVRNWDDIEKILHHTFYNELRIDPSEHPIMITESTLNPLSNREKFTQILFETFGVPSMYVTLGSVCSLYGAGRASGVVLDMGEGVIQVIPIYEGYCIPNAIKRLDMGGRNLTEYLMKLLTERGYSFYDSRHYEIVQHMKETLCRVAEDFDYEMNDHFLVRSNYNKTYTLPDGQEVSLGNAIIRCPEILFTPSLMGREQPGIHELVAQCINECPTDIRRHMWSNVLISGGTSLLKGLPERLELELKKLKPKSVIARVVAVPERKYTSWIGASLLASILKEDKFISSADYDEEGPVIVHRKCF